MFGGFFLFRFLCLVGKKGKEMEKRDSFFFFVVVVVVVAYGRVNDPMAKLQFLRVGWGGVGWGGDDDIL